MVRLRSALVFGLDFLTYRYPIPKIKTNPRITLTSRKGFVDPLSSIASDGFGFDFV